MIQNEQTKVNKKEAKNKSSHQKKQEKIAKALELQASKNAANSNSSAAAVGFFNKNTPHVNYAYNSTINSQFSLDTTYSIYKPPRLLPSNILKKPILSHLKISTNASHQNKQQQSNEQLIDKCEKQFDLGNLQVINGKIQNKANLIRESSQLLPQSIEKQMVKNLQSLKFTSNLASSSSSLENGNQVAKFTELPAQPIQPEQQLKDEDAWLPIMAIVQEQIQKYEEEKSNQAEFCVL